MLNIVGFPNVIGAIDCTLIPIRKFKKDIKEYISRRKKCELNVMVVCGPDHLIYYCSNRWPGGVNDSRIFRESAMRELLESGTNVYSTQEYLLSTVENCSQNSKCNINMKEVSS